MAFHISDTHFNHKNIIEYCDRPFENVIEMEEYIVRKWNSVVSKTDIVYHHGDFILGASQEYTYDLIKRLNGKIILLMGNHDRKGIGWFESCGFKEVNKKSFIINDKYIITHKPIEREMIPEGYINIHGHIHNHNNGQIKEQSDIMKYINVSCEVIDYTPIWID